MMPTSIEGIYAIKKTIFLVLLVLIACTPRTTQETRSTPEQIIEPNTAIVLREIPGLKDVFDATGIIDLTLNNKSQSKVLFPPDFNAEIYVQNGKRWDKINNSFGYSTYDQVLPLSSDYPPGMAVAVAPDLSQITARPVVVRIKVKGTLSDSGKEVEAFLDVKIE